MDLMNFYEQILPPTGHFCLFRTSTRRHVWANSLVELAALTTAVEGATDIYFATASFENSESRTQANVDALKAFRLDIDAGANKLAKHGEDKVYATQRDALAGLVTFSKEAKLPPSLIVSSGEGLHVYYTLDTPCAEYEWRAVAKSFQKFGARLGLKIDSAVTSDSARILRPVGTLHPNGSVVSVLKATGKVYTLDEFRQAVQTEDDTDAALVAPAFAADADINADLGLTVQGPPKTIKKILQRCANVRWAYQHQPEVDEPHWRAVIGLTVHTVEGVTAAHAMSCRHPEYDAGQVEEKFARWTAGPTTCATLEGCHKESCAGCEYRGKVKSPITLGAMTPDETEALPDDEKPAPPPQKKTEGRWSGHIPEGFDVVPIKGVNTLVHRTEVEKENEAGDTVRVRVTVPMTREIFWFGHWADAESDRDTAQFTMFRLDESGLLSTFTMEQERLASRAEFIKFLASKGIHTTTDRRASISMEHYGKALAQQVKTQQRRTKVNDHYGLRNLPTGEMVAVHGEHILHPDGRISTALIGPTLQGEVSSYGVSLPYNDRGEWEPSIWASHIFPLARKHVEFLNTHYGHQGMQRYQLAIALALSGPLMAFADSVFDKGSKLPPFGLTVTLYSRESARGKSAAMKAAMLAYGNPAHLTQVKDKTGSTPLARLANLSHAGTTPFVMDEMGSIEAQTLNELIKSIGNGVARTRLDKTGAIVQSEPWALTCLMGTNTSQRQILSASADSSDATQFRLFEIDVDDMPKYDEDLKEQFANEWAQIMPCAGALGAAFYLMIVRTGAVKLREMMIAREMEVARMVRGAKQSGRYLHRGMATILVMHEIASKAGIFPFKIEDLLKAFNTAYEASIDSIEEYGTSMNALELLMDCLRDLAPHTVVTHTETRRTGTIRQYDEPLNSRVPDVVKARHIVASCTTTVSVFALREWCNEKHIRVNDLIGAAKAAGVLRSIYPCRRVKDSEGRTQWSDRYCLTKGMRASTGTMVQCYMFHVKHLAEALGHSDSDLLQEAITGDNVVSMAAGVVEGTAV